MFSVQEKKMFSQIQGSVLDQEIFSTLSCIYFSLYCGERKEKLVEYVYCVVEKFKSLIFINFISHYFAYYTLKVN